MPYRWRGSPAPYGGEPGTALAQTFFDLGANLATLGEKAFEHQTIQEETGKGALAGMQAATSGQPLPIGGEFSLAGRVFNASAKKAYLLHAGNQIRDALGTAAETFDTDPDSFNKVVEGVRSRFAKIGLPADVSSAIENDIADLGSRYGAAVRRTAIRQAKSETYLQGVRMLDNLRAEAELAADAGNVDGILRAERAHSRLVDEMMAAGLLTGPQAVALERRRAAGVVGAATSRGLDDAYDEDGPIGADRYVDHVESRLSEGGWNVDEAAVAFQQEAAAAGIRVRVTSKLRTYEEQAALHRKFMAGEMGGPVAPPGKSRHEIGEAFDVDTSGLSKEQLAQLGAIGESLGLEWGGRWKGSKYDPVHFQRAGAGSGVGMVEGSPAERARVVEMLRRRSRQRAADDRRAEIEADREHKKNSSQVYMDALDTEAAGDLTPEWVQQRRDKMTPGDYEKAMRLAARADRPETDPHVYASLMAQADDGMDIASAADDAYIEKHLTRADRDRLVFRAEKEKDSRRKIGAKYVRDQLKPGLGTSLFGDDSAMKRSMAEADAEFSTWYDEVAASGRPPSAQEVRAKAEEIVAARRKPVGGGISPQMVQQMRKNLEEKRAKGAITRDDYAKEAARIMQLEQTYAIPDASTAERKP